MRRKRNVGFDPELPLGLRTQAGYQNDDCRRCSAKRMSSHGHANAVTASAATRTLLKGGQNPELAQPLKSDQRGHDDERREEHCHRRNDLHYHVRPFLHHPRPPASQVTAQMKASPASVAAMVDMRGERL